MEVTKIVYNKSEDFNHVINPSLLRDGDIVQGLALVQNVRNGITSTEKPVVRFYLRGQYNLVVQGNLYLANRKVYSNEDSLEFLNKIVYIKGIVNIFGNNRIIIDLSEIQQFDTNLKPQAFFKENPLLDKYKEKLKNYIKLLRDNNYTNCLLENQSIDIISTLSDRLDTEEGSSIGDWLIITVKLMEAFLENTLKPDYSMAYLCLTYMYTYCLVNNADFDGNNSSKSAIWKIDKTLQICSKFNLLLNTQQNSYFYNLLGVVYCNEPALTHLAKIISKGIPYFKSFLISYCFEYSPDLVHSDSHLKLR